MCDGGVRVRPHQVLHDIARTPLAPRDAPENAVRLFLRGSLRYLRYGFGAFQFRPSSKECFRIHDRISGSQVSNGYLAATEASSGVIRRIARVSAKSASL